MKKPRVRERSLRRCWHIEAGKRKQGCFGLCWKHKGIIEIDPKKNAHSWQRLDTLVHETLHFICPEWSENHVRTATKVLRDVLWEDNWRRMQK